MYIDDSSSNTNFLAPCLSNAGPALCFRPARPFLSSRRCPVSPTNSLLTLASYVATRSTSITRSSYRTLFVPARTVLGSSRLLVRTTTTTTDSLLSVWKEMEVNRIINHPSTESNPSTWFGQSLSEGRARGKWRETRHEVSYLSVM